MKSGVTWQSGCDTSVSASLIVFVSYRNQSVTYESGCYQVEQGATGDVGLVKTVIVEDGYFQFWG